MSKLSVMMHNVFAGYRFKTFFFLIKRIKINCYHLFNEPMSLQQAIVSAAAVIFARACAVFPPLKQLVMEEQNQRPNSFNRQKKSVYNNICPP